MNTTVNNPSQSKPFFKTNVSTLERIIMVSSGAYLLYNALSKNKKNISEAGAGGAMLLRGISGYCPMYDAADHLINDKASNVNIRIKSVINKPTDEVYSF